MSSITNTHLEVVPVDDHVGSRVVRVDYDLVTAPTMSYAASRPANLSACTASNLVTLQSQPAWPRLPYRNRRS